MEWNEHWHFTDLLAYFERTRTPLTSFIHSSITNLILQIWLLFHFTSLQFLLMCQSTLRARRTIFLKHFGEIGAVREWYVYVTVYSVQLGTDIWPLHFNVMRGTTTTRDYSAKQLKIIRKKRKEGKIHGQQMLAWISSDYFESLLLRGENDWIQVTTDVPSCNY